MSYADIASRMVDGDGTDGRHFKVDTNQLVFKHYNKDAVFNPELCSKEEMDAFVRYMQMYGGGEWHDGVHSEVPYYYTHSKTEDTIPLGCRWVDIQDIIKNNVPVWLYDNFQFAGSKIAIPYPHINKEYVFTDTRKMLCRFKNAMQSYYNKLKCHDNIQTRIDVIVKEVQTALVGMATSEMPTKVADLYDSITVDYCTYRINGLTHYVPNSCLVGRIYLVDTSSDEVKYKYVDGKLTFNNFNILLESSGFDVDTIFHDIAAIEYNEEYHPMELVLFDVYNDYGYCVRIMSKSKMLLFETIYSLLWNLTRS